jgi:tight adherence protein C
MAFLFVIGIAFLAAAAALVARAISLSRVRATARVREIEVYGFKAGESSKKAASAFSALRQRLDGIAGRIGRSVQGDGWRAQVPLRQLRGAGLYTISADVFQGYRVIAAGGVSGLILLDGILGGSFSVVLVLSVLTIAAIGWFGPALLVRTRAQKRWDTIDRDLPELIDLLTATIEAGLGFAGSLQLVANRFEGPLGQELRLTLREQSMGLSTDRALSNLLERCETPSVRAFVRAVTQGETLGVSIGAMMRNLATETRKRRRQLAQEKIQKAPVKMLFPLVFMIFPPLLIVLLYPSGYEVVTQLGK